MRPAGRGPRDSLYFDYPHFTAPAGTTRATLRDRVPVAIAGAGPVGLTAALTLASQGVASVVLEKQDTFNDGSRAICISRSSFYILQRIGAASPFLDKALGWTMGRSFFRGQQILEFEMADSEAEKYRPMYNLQQQYIERFLWEAAEASPLIELRWQSEVMAVEDVTDGVLLGVSDSEDSYLLPAAYLLAADGASSSIRRMRGLRMQGENYEGRYVIADVRMDHPYPTIRRALFDPACRPGGTVLIHRQPDNIWRIDYQLGDDESAEDAVQEAVVRASVAAVLDDIGHHGDWELEWWSVYSANTLALEDYRDGRVFFIGDSAHIVPIFGVRGLNNGLADAQNIGWKLAWVLNQRAGPALLDSYSPERRGATLDVFANASKSTRFMTPPSHGWQVMRDAALSLALSQSFAGQLANPRQMTPYTYTTAPLTLPDDPGFDAGPVSGAPLCDARIADGYLSDRLGDGFTLLLCDTEPAAFDAALARFGDRIVIADLPAAGAAAERLGASPGTAYLIRPDMQVLARWRRVDPAQVAEVLAAALSERE